MSGMIGESLGQTHSWDELPDLLPSTAFERVDPIGLTRQLARGLGNAAATVGTVDDYGRPIMEAQPSVNPVELNRLYATPDATQYGVTPLNFTAPVPDSVAQSMHDAKREEIARAEAAARQPDGIGATLGNFGVGMLDPVGAAATLMPVIGEARMAGMLARAGVTFSEGLAGQSALRAATGAATGAVMQAPLSALRYGLSQQEQADYHMSDVMADVIMGTLLGGGLHVAIGGAGDLLGRSFRQTGAARVLDADPVLRENVAQTAVAAVAEARPVNVAPLIEMAEARQARDEIEALLRRQTALDAEHEAARPAAFNLPPDRATAIAQGEAELAGHLANARNLRDEAATATEAASRASLDPDSAMRLDAVDVELGRAIPRARRASLEAERAMLLEGRPASDITTSPALEAQRSAAQAQGLTTAAGTAEAAAARAEAALTDLRAQDAADRAAHQGAVQAEDTRTIAATAAADARQAIADAMAARSVRRAAYGMGLRLSDRDASDLARAVLRGELTPEEAMQALAGWRTKAGPDEIRPGAPEFDPQAAAQPGLDAINQRMGAIADELHSSDAAARAHGAPAPEAAAASQQAADAARAAPKLEAPAAPKAEDLAHLEDSIDRTRKAGKLAPDHEAEIARIDETVAASQSYADALLQAGACLIRGLG